MRAFLLIVAVLTAGPASGKGSLVIVGGGLSPDNAEIYRAFIDRVDGGKIALIPSASGEPQASLDAFAANLLRYGVASDRITHVRLAEVDDPATAADEAAWAGNARNVSEIAKIKAVNGIWFTGGDQARTMRLLVRKGKDTPMLAAIRKRLKTGAVVGGTSAGAAIMGSGMIVCGDPKRAKEPLGKSSADCAQQEGQSEPLVLGRGLGFLPNHVIDQHFSQRGRLLRLVRAQACGAGHGIGIDEDTAIVVDLAGRRAHVIGSGRVTQIESPRPRNDCVYPTGTMDIVIAKAGQSFGIAK
jgi:cyanophycinase